MQRLIILTQYLDVGGLERLVAALSLGLRNTHEWEPVVAFYERASPFVNLKDQIVQSGVPVCELKKKQGFSLRLVFKIFKLALKTRAKVIHTHDTGPLVYGVLAKILSLGYLKIVHTQHSFLYLGKKRKDKLYFKICASFVDQFVGISREIVEGYCQVGIKKNKIKFIQNGINYPVNPVLTLKDKIGLREDLCRYLITVNEGLESTIRSVIDRPWVLCLARLHTGKGQDHVLQVWKSLPEALQRSAVLVFVGPETTRNRLNFLKSLALNLPYPKNIIFAGSTLVPEKWIQSSHFFISGSESEGMPLAPLEAIGSGLPSLLSDIEGHCIFKHLDPRLVGFFKISDPNKGANWLAHQLAQIQQTQESLLSQCWNQAEGIRQKFGIQKMIDSHTRLYRKYHERKVRQFLEI